MGRVVDHLRKIADGRNVDRTTDSTPPLVAALILAAALTPNSRQPLAGKAFATRTRAPDTAFAKAGATGGTPGSPTTPG